MKILKIHTLKKRWMDRDNLMLHANFQILVDFVEQEHPFKFIDWTSDEAHINAAKEIRSLYRWWTRSRLNRPDPFAGLKNDEKPTWREHFIPEYEDDGKTIKHYVFVSSHPNYPKYEAAFKKYVKLEARREKEEQENLIRLIKIRRFLWT